MYDFRLLFTAVVVDGKLQSFERVFPIEITNWSEDIADAKAEFAEQVLWDAFQEDKEDAPEIYMEILKDISEDTPDYVPEEMFRMYA